MKDDFGIPAQDEYDEDVQDDGHDDVVEYRHATAAIRNRACDRRRTRIGMPNDVWRHVRRIDANFCTFSVQKKPPWQNRVTKQTERVANRPFAAHLYNDYSISGAQKNDFFRDCVVFSRFVCEKDVHGLMFT